MKANGVERNTDANAIFHLFHKRRVKVKLMNGRTPLVDIREFYEKNNQLLPVRLFLLLDFISEEVSICRERKAFR